MVINSLLKRYYKFYSFKEGKKLEESAKIFNIVYVVKNQLNANKKITKTINLKK